jgi:capsular polysaccharide biosynthesis protein
MTQEQNENISFDSVLEFLWKWRKHLLIVGILTMVLSAVFSSPYFIAPKYKSQHVFYPTTNNSISTAFLTDLTQRQKDPLEFGEEEEAEKALQILQSSRLSDRLIRNFKLMEHYKINPEGQFPRTELGRKYDANINFARTRYLSIEITVLDEDPQMAAEIANGIAILYDSIQNEIQAEVSIPAKDIIERAYKAKENEVVDIKNAMREIGLKGVTNYEEQSRALAEEIYKASSAGNSRRLNQLMEQQKLLVSLGGEEMALKESLILELDKLSDVGNRYKKAEIDVNETLTHKFTVSSASKAEKKSYPIRWLVVFVSLITALLMAVFIIILLSKLKSIKARV